MRQPSRKSTLLVVDQEIFTYFVQKLVSEAGGYIYRAGIKMPNASAASKLLKIPQIQLWRFMNQKRTVIRRTTFRMLLKHLPPKDRIPFSTAFFNPQTHAVLVAYKKWTTEAREQVILCTPTSWRQSKRNGIAKQGPSQIKKTAERQQQFRELERYLRKTLKGHYNDFDTKIKERTLEAGRIRLALDRIIAPLLDSQDSAFMERDWRTMSQRELIVFIEAGMKRELMLLKRSHDAQRAQEIVLQSR